MYKDIQETVAELHKKEILVGRERTKIRGGLAILAQQLGAKGLELVSRRGSIEFRRYGFSFDDRDVVWLEAHIEGEKLIIDPHLPTRSEEGVHAIRDTLLSLEDDSRLKQLISERLPDPSTFPLGVESNELKESGVMYVPDPKQVS